MGSIGLNRMKLLQTFLIIAAVLFFLYGCYWVAKAVSYTIFYEDMVKQTITEMVKQEALK